MPRQIRITGLVKHAYYSVPKGSISPSLIVRICNIKPFGECTTMTAQDLPATARAMSLVIAIALVATAFAPLLFTAARVVA